MQSTEAFQTEYDTRTAELVIRERRFEIMLAKSLDRFIQPENPMSGFPLWSKIWEASILLADHMARTEPDPDRRILEIGCGLGLVGTVAASFGHCVTMTEYDEHALAFARANARLNPGPGSPPEILKMDWHAPSLQGRFDWIIGSEVVYREADFAPLLRLFRTYLRPEGIILLAAELRKTTMAFLNRLSRDHHIEARKKVLHGKGREIPIAFCTIRPRDPADPVSL
ncbi:MAG: methyltransferase [Deltaproteobacteria bacterium]|nr:methyltransferase [Deltaproteobacteria bacterium]